MGKVVLSTAARADLRAYSRWLRVEAGHVTADVWMDALLDWIGELDAFPERGTPRPDLGEELRTRVFRKSVTIAYVVADDIVTILGVFARGRNLTVDALAGRRWA